jgi:hypothetical protein
VAQKLRDEAAQTRTADPVSAKSLERIRDYVEVLLSSPNLATEKEAAVRALRLESLEKDGDVRRETAFEIEADLRASLLELMSDDYVYMCLQTEKQRLTRRRSDSASDPFWTDYFPRAELKNLLNAFERDIGKFKEPARAAAIGRLVELYKQSHHELRRHRARAAQAGLYLARLRRPVLLLLIAVIVLLVGAQTLDWFSVGGGRWAELVALVVAVVAGALGGVLGLMFRFRDMRGRTRELLSESDMGRVQPFIGAATALIVVLVVKSGLITIAGLETDNLAQLAVLGFVAGFSEPVFFGVIDRLARVTSPGSSDDGKS